MFQDMHTRVLAADDPAARAEALDLLRRGEVIALPTDTVYGVAADGFNADAIEKLYLVKDRPAQKAIPLLLGSAEEMELVAREIPSSARQLADAFFPGGLTLVLPALQAVPTILRAEGDTVAVRVPDHELVRHLAGALGRPLAATSANLSGGANPMTAEEVLAQLGGRLPLILDGGSTPGAVPSTVLDCTVDPPRVIREGALPVERVEQVLGRRLNDQ